MKKIIVPTDFSEVSLNAAEFAMDMAMAINADILLFNAYQIPIAYSRETPLILLSVDELKKASEAQLNALKGKIDQHTSGRITVSTEARMGDTIDELQKICGEIQPFLVIMGAIGKTGIERIVFGSTALSAIRHLEWPVICIPSGKKYGKGINKIGLACDLRQLVDTTPVSLIKEIVKEFKAELHVLNAEPNEKQLRTRTVEESYQWLDALRDLHPTYHYTKSGDVEDGILQLAEKNKLDLLIAIPKKHKLLEGILNPSSTKQFIFHSPIPVMCIQE